MKRIYTTCITLLIIFSSVFSQSEKTYFTQQFEGDLQLDGKGEDEAWKLVKWEGKFIQTEPENGQKPTFDTRFKILHNQEHLFVLIQAFDKRPDEIVISHMPRDFFEGDYVEINIDSDFNQTDAFSFTVTAAGIRGDEHIQSADNWFNDWNPNWEVKTSIDKKGWMAEMKIPFQELEAFTQTEQWGIQINRSIERLDEGSSWTSIPDEDKWVESFGLLKGIKGIPLSPIPSMQTLISAEQWHADVEKLYQSLKISYPSLYRYRSKEFIQRVYEETHQNLSESQNILQGYAVIASFLSKIGDGHMKVEFPSALQEVYQEQVMHLPFELEIWQDQVWIQNPLLDHEGLNGARILSWNGEEIDQLIGKMMQLIPSDGLNRTGKYRALSQNVELYLALGGAGQKEIDIEFIPQGQTRAISQKCRLVTQEAFQKSKEQQLPSESKASFDLEMVNDIGIMKIRTFNDAEGFQEFVDQSFASLASKGIDKLVLDLRGNGGGEERNAIHLYAYVATAPFKYYDRYEVKVDPGKTLSQHSTLISYETLNFLARQASADSVHGGVVLDRLEALEGRFIDPTNLQEPKSENHFDGEVVVLMDGGSFSATSEFCAVMQRDQRATFVGTETGGAFDGNTSGMYDQITLPNSRLKIRIPLIKYVMATEACEFSFGQGVVPDYLEHDPNKQMRLAKKLLTGKK